MPLSLLGFPTIILASIGPVEIDVVLDEAHDYPSRLTQNPVEDGTVFTDHVILDPVSVSMTCRVTDASLTLARIKGPGAADDAFRSLVKLQRDREPFTVVTGLAVYQNMMFEQLTFLRRGDDGRSVRFQAVVREIQVVGVDVGTNRDSIAQDVAHSALASVSRGIVPKVAA